MLTMLTRTFEVLGLLWFYANAHSVAIDGLHLTQLPTRRDCFVDNFNTSFCLPSVLISGFPKCGSSYLFYILSQHGKIVPTSRKELCLGRPPAITFAALTTFLPKPTRKHILSGCLLPKANMNMYSLIPSAKRPKVLLVVRNVADMLWSAYNYWCFEAIEDCEPGFRTSRTAHRSPQHFHSLITSNSRMGRGISLDMDGACFKSHITAMQEYFGSANVLVISSEAFHNNTRRVHVAEKILRFLGVKVSSRRSQTWMIDVVAKSNILVNAGSSINSRGSSVVSTNKSEEGVYEISGFRPMLEETRKLIMQKWFKECVWLRDTFDDIQNDCKNS